MSLSMPGMGTGLDIQSMAKQMATSALSAKNSQLTKQETEVNADVAALNALESALKSFYSKLDNLSDPETFGTLKNNLSEDDQEIFTAKVDETAVANSYQIAIQQLATKDKWVAMQATSSKEEIFSGPGTRDITITVGTDKTFTVQMEAGETLNSLMGKINNSKDNPGVDASIITGAGSARLTLTSNKTGTDNAITSIDLGNGTKLEDIDTDGNGVPDANIKQAVNAQFSIDGIEVVSQTNTVDDAITGVTLELKQVTQADQPIDLNLSTDTDTMKESIESLVSSYNSLRDVIDQVSKSTAGTKGQETVRAALAGDTLVTSLTNQLREALITPVDGSNYGTLAGIGIITKQNGDLEVDSKVLDQALKDNPAEVVDLFIGGKTALTRLIETTEIYIGTQTSSNDQDDDSTYEIKKEGLIKTRLDALKEDQTEIADAWTALNQRAEDVYQRYFNELNAMDLAVQQMNASMQSLNSMLVSSI